MIVNDSLWMIEYKEECYNDLLDSSFTNETTDTHSNIIFTLVKDLTALQVAQEVNIVTASLNFLNILQLCIIFSFKAFESTLREEEHTHQPTLETFEDQALFFLSYSQVNDLRCNKLFNKIWLLILSIESCFWIRKLFKFVAVSGL